MGDFKRYLTEKSSPRIRRIRVRIKNGKIQRNVKVSGVSGFRMNHGRLVRMSSTERMHRRKGARKAKIKIRAKRARILMKRKRSMMKRHSLGLS
jgi:hypothetical protein